MNWPLTPFPIWLHELIYVVRWDIPRITKTQSGNFQFVFKNLNLCPKVYSLQSQEMHQTFETNNPNSLHEVWSIKSLCFPVKTQVTWGMPEPKYFKVLSGQNDPNFRFNLRFNHFRNRKENVNSNCLPHMSTNLIKGVHNLTGCTYTEKGNV